MAKKNLLLQLVMGQINILTGLRAKLCYLKWSQKPICALGNAFSYDSVKREVKKFLIYEKSTEIQKMFNLWC